MSTQEARYKLALEIIEEIGWALDSEKIRDIVHIALREDEDDGEQARTVD